MAVSPPVSPPGAHRQSSHHAESEDPGAPGASSHAGDGGVGMVAQELCRDEKGPVFGTVASPWRPHSWFMLSPGLIQLESQCHRIASVLGSHPDLGCHSLTLEEAFSCTRTSASFTSNKTSCRGNEGEEALISRALSSVFNQTLTRDNPNAEVMKRSQPQLFQVSSMLFFYPHHPVLPPFNLFKNNSQRLKQQ